MYRDPVKRWWLTGAILSEVSATLSLRAALDHPGWYVLVVTGYLASFGFLARALEHMAVGVAYGIWGAGGITLTAIVAAFLFGDALTVVMGIGIVLVIAGVLLVELGSESSGAQLKSEVAASRGAGAEDLP